VGCHCLLRIGVLVTSKPQTGKNYTLSICLWQVEPIKCSQCQVLNTDAHLLGYSSVVKNMTQFDPPFSWQPTPVLLPGKSHGSGASIHGVTELDLTERLHFTFPSPARLVLEIILLMYPIDAEHSEMSLLGLVLSTRHPSLLF